MYSKSNYMHIFGYHSNSTLRMTEAFETTQHNLCWYVYYLDSREENVCYILHLGHTKLMSWWSDFRSIIVRGRDFFFFFFNIKKKFVVRSRTYLIQGGGIFANIFTQRSTLQRQMSLGEFFSQLVIKLRLMGSPWTSIFYHTTSLSLFQTDSQKLAGASSHELTSVIWTLQTASSVLSRLYSTDTFH